MPTERAAHDQPEPPHFVSAGAASLAQQTGHEHHGAALVGDAIDVAGGGPAMGGGVQSAVHEAFVVG